MNHNRLTAAMFGAILAAALLTAGPAAAAPLRPQAITGDSHSSAVATRAAETLASYDAFSHGRWDHPADPLHRRSQRNRRRRGRRVRSRRRSRCARRGPARATEHQVAVLAALSQLGVEYRSNSSEPGVSFDCSGLTAYAWGRAGVSLYRQSGVQISDAAPRDRGSALAGDLVQYPGHVMMYLGVGDAIVHASNPEADVELSTLRRPELQLGRSLGVVQA